MKGKTLERMDVAGFTDVIITAGGYVDAAGKIAGVFASAADARAEDADARALGTLGWDTLTPTQQAVARRNSARL